MTITRLHPSPLGPLDVDDDETWVQLAELYALAGPEVIRVNMIASVNGSAVGDDGSSESLSNRVDRKILGIIRRAADVVVVGAETVRREGYLSPAHSTLAVVTSSGDLSGHRLEDSPLPPLILCPADAAERVKRELTGIPHTIALLESEDLDAEEIVHALRSAGLRSIVCEGGPTLAAAFIDAGVVDELCLTTSPRLHSPGTPMLGRVDAMPRATLEQLLVDDESTLYARWRLGR